MTLNTLVGTFDLEPEWATLPIKYSFDLWDNEFKREILATQRYLDHCEEFSHRVTFFVVGLFAKAVPNLIKEISDRGHEIASHSLTHPDLALLPHDQFYHEAYTSKVMLEDLIGKEIKGFRAPSFSITYDQLHILDGIGYKYDSSVSSAKRLHGGKVCIENLATSPIKILKFDGLKFGEREFTVLGGGYLRIIPTFILKKLEQKNLGNMYYVHPHDFYSMNVNYTHFNAKENILRRVAIGSTLKKIQYLHEEFNIIRADEYFSL